MNNKDKKTASPEDLGDFQQLLRACHEIASNFPDGVVFIGGIAVYLHAINNQKAKELAEVTHDADFYISIADMGDLRDIEEIVPNRRLNKHQLKKYGFEFDIYTERHSALIVPYDQVMAHAVTYDQTRVASLEHLLVLKLEAYKDRHASTKGQKDAKDLIRIAVVSQSTNQKFKADLAIGYLDDRHIALLKQVARGPEFMSLARGNAKYAKELRTQFQALVDSIQED